MDKSTLRHEYLEKRSQLSPEEIKRRSEGIWHQLQQYLELDQISSLHLYLSIPQRQEIDTQPIIDHVRANHPGMALVVPKVVDEEQMHHYLLQEHTVLTPNSWGIPEPEEGVIYDLNQLQVVLVPLIIFDVNGHRIGYGKGYYDRFLCSISPAIEKIGLSLFSPVPAIHTEPTDIALDVVITPWEIFRFQKP